MSYVPEVALLTKMEKQNANNAHHKPTNLMKAKHHALLVQQVLIRQTQQAVKHAPEEAIQVKMDRPSVNNAHLECINQVQTKLHV